MLERMCHIARRLQPVRGLLALLMALAVLNVGRVLLISASDAEDVALIPSVLLFVWALLGLAFIQMFSHVPPAAHRQDRFLMRVRRASFRALYYAFVLLFVLTSAFLLLTTWQLISAWRMMY